MYVNSDVNVLSFEGNFVLLHTGTVLICCLILVCSHLQKYKPIIIVPTFSSENMKNTPRGCLAAGGSQPPRASACSVYHSVSDCKHSNSDCVMKDKVFYPRTTKRYKNFIRSNYNYYKNKERRK
jgi:hypothetical protein